NITGGFALRVDSNSKIADYLSMIGFYGLPLDYLDSFNDKVNAVTVADIKAAFSRRINADKMLTVLVGGETN
ncbi:insulinase family protein, partial [Methylophaga sp. OBS4]|nr:insulinase family protein [Methylophaga sp. OBS4]